MGQLLANQAISYDIFSSLELPTPFEIISGVSELRLNVLTVRQARDSIAANNRLLIWPYQRPTLTKSKGL